MTTFDDGPAAAEALDLRRSPLFLRVTRSRAGKWDALDQLDDVPRPGERVWAYRRVGAVMQGFIDYRTKGGRRKGEPFVMARYGLCPAQPDEATLRDNAKWREWCVAEHRANTEG